MSREFVNETDPIALFSSWLDEATASEPNDPNAMALATVDGDGMPNVRIVLLKGFDERGFVFYTNFDSAKGRELLASRKAALGFHWKTLGRQVRVRGAVAPVAPAEADAYFVTRPRGSRIGAWASQQSRPLESRAALEAAVAAFSQKFPAEDIPRPENWSGFRLTPAEIEFWSAGAFRLHARRHFRREGEGWAETLLYP
jgi:pyridoxamine 5'-phosphate oxidase